MSLRGKIHSIGEKGLEVEHVPIYLPVISTLLSKHKGKMGCPLSAIMEPRTISCKKIWIAVPQNCFSYQDNSRTIYCRCTSLSCYTKNAIVTFLPYEVRLGCILSSFHEWNWTVSLLGLLLNHGTHWAEYTLYRLLHQQRQCKGQLAISSITVVPHDCYILKDQFTRITNIYLSTNI